MGTKVRNDKIDIVRGIAILLVVMGHIIYEFQGAEHGFLYNAIFAVQMPLFMIISGYITIYSRPVDSISAFGKRLLKRTLALMLPWLVWTLMRYFVQGVEVPLLRYLLYLFEHMDVGYWFLVSLWTIDLVFNLSLLFSSLGKQKELKKYPKLFVQCVYVVILFGCLFLIGMLIGFNSFAIKYSLYYLPFFCLGYLFAYVYDDISEKKWFNTASSVFITACGVVFAVLCYRFNVKNSDDTVLNILIRLLASLSGCTVIFGTINKLSCNSKAWSVIKFYGKHSLELYVIHYFFLNLIKTY